MVSRRSAITGFCALCAGFAFPGGTLVRPAEAAGGLPKTTLSPDEALAKLVDGNKRFVADNPIQPDISSHRRHELAAGQAPWASILTCADSRTPPEELFGAGLGELFTTRVAGNTLSQSIQGSLEYSTAILGVPLILVLGHEKCGAVAAAVDVAENGTHLPGALIPMVEPILPAVAAARKMKGDLLTNAVKENAKRTAAKLRQAEAILTGQMKAGKLKIVSGYYTLEAGTVAILEG